MSNQFKDFVAYDLSKPINDMIASTMDPMSVAENVNLLNARYLPTSLISATASNSNLRDAILHEVIDGGPYVLEVFIQAVKSYANDELSLVTYAEYAAAIAYAQGQPDLAKAIVLRIPPTTNSSLIKNIAVGLSNGMSSSSFKELLRNSTSMSASLLA
jgi:hypothetical protein